MVRSGLLLFAIFSLEKNKKETVMSATQKNQGRKRFLSDGRGLQANEKEKEEQLYTACDLVNAVTHVSEFLG